MSRRRGELRRLRLLHRGGFHSWGVHGASPSKNERAIIPYRMMAPGSARFCCWLHHPAAVGMLMMPTPVRIRTSTSSEFDTPTDNDRTAWRVELADMSLLEHQNGHEKSRRSAKASRSTNARAGHKRLEREALAERIGAPQRDGYLLLCPLRALVTLKLPSRSADTLMPNAVVSSRFAINASGALCAASAFTARWTCQMSCSPGASRMICQADGIPPLVAPLFITATRGRMA